MATKWGILSAGGISSDFTANLVSQSPEEHQVVAVGARSKQRAQEFADKYGIKAAYGSYEECVKDPNIEIVYIGSIHPEHYRLGIMCLNAGKHVLCEKPLTLTVAAAEELFKVAKEKKLFFMEGYWCRFFPVFREIRREIDSGALGDVRMMTSHFFLNVCHVDRIKTPELGGGGLYDLGCYTVQFADFVFREFPQSIHAVGQVENGVDIGATITLKYSGDRTATLSYNTRVPGAENSSQIFGTKGCAVIDDHSFQPLSLRSPVGKFQFNLPDCKYPMNYPRSEGLQFEQRCVRACLQKGLLECPEMTHESSLNVSRILEEVHRQLGASYNFDHTV